jgi:uncharacterized phage protein (TIGR01671 family)
MREIKFRAWYKPKGKMYTRSLESVNLETKVLGVYTVSEGYQQLRMSDFELMQYTGLKDKNGKEIYEGDIVKDEENFVGQILYEDGSFKVHCMDLMATGHLFGQACKYLNAIGNIYENPELLEDSEGGLLKCYESGTL